MDTNPDVEAGLTVTEMADAATIVIVAEEDFVESATDVACNSTWAEPGKVVGAVYVAEVPVTLLNAPQERPLQPLPLRVQLTPLFWTSF